MVDHTTSINQVTAEKSKLNRVLRTAMTIEVSTDHLQEPVATLDTIMACLRRLRSENGAPPIETLEQDGDRGGETAPVSRVVELSAEFGFRAERAELDSAGLKATGFVHPISSCVRITTPSL
jgi:hypothetical protein